MTTECGIVEKDAWGTRRLQAQGKETQESRQGLEEGKSKWKYLLSIWTGGR